MLSLLMLGKGHQKSDHKPSRAGLEIKLIEISDFDLRTP